MPHHLRRSARLLESLESRLLLSGLPTYDLALALGASGDDSVSAMVTDPAGNIYLAGTFSGTVDFDPSPATFNLTAQAAPGSPADAFLAKYSASGSLLWAFALASPGAESISNLALDPDGNLLIAGNLSSAIVGHTITVDFDPSPATATLSVTNPLDCFVAKYDPAGNFLWLHGFGGSGYDQAASLVTDSAGNAYFSGTFQDTIDLTAGPSPVSLTTASVSGAAFLVKLDGATGDLLWHGQLEADNQIGAPLLALSPADDLLVVGSFTGTLDLDPAHAGAHLVTPTDWAQYFLKLDPATGTLRASATIDNTAAMFASLTLDHAGDLILTGDVYADTDLDPASSAGSLAGSVDGTCFVAKFDSSFHLLWAHALASDGFSNANSAVAVDVYDNIYFDGRFSGSLVYPDADAGLALPTETDRTFVYKLDPAGHALWSLYQPGWITAVAFNPANDRLLIAGFFDTAFDADPSAAGTQTLTPAGSNDAFLTVLTDPTPPNLAPTGYIDSASDAALLGWAADPNSPLAITIRLDIDGATHLTTTASIVRTDLLAPLGSADHGFAIALPLLAAGTHTIALYALDSTTHTATRIGTRTLTIADPLFSESYYLAHNPDVAAAVAAGTFATGYEHFLAFGQSEDRPFSPYFSEASYLAANPDVAAAVAEGALRSGFEHYTRYGRAEHRAVAPLFDESFYLAHNPDVAAAVAAGTVVSAYEHFLLYGQFEHRAPSASFDEAYYLSHNPDVATALVRGSFASAYTHYLLFGQAEHRPAHS